MNIYIYINSLSCIKVIRGENVSFRIASTRYCYVPLAFQGVYGCSNERSENGEGEDGSEISGGGERVKIA